MRIKEYFLALQPRRIIWFVGEILLVLATIATFTLTAAGIQHWWFKGAAMLALQFFVLVIVLFISGFIAWDKERTDKEEVKGVLNARWPKLTATEREALAQLLRPFDALPEIGILRNDAEDCRNFAADLCAAMESATNERARGFVIPVRSAPCHLESGIAIISRSNDNRAHRLQTALKEIAKVEAVLSQADFSGFEIHIGARAS